MFALALAAIALAGCPHDSSLGSIAFVRGNTAYSLSLGDCVDRTVGRASRPVPGPQRSPDGRFVADVRAGGTGKTAKETIWITDRRSGAARPVFGETQYYTQIGPGDTPGPIRLLGWSGDDRWVFFTIDPGGSGSIAADGLTLRVVPATGGAVHRLGPMLPYPDYLTWCSGHVVFAGGMDRVAIAHKRLLIAGPPSWRPAPLWNEPTRSFASPTCSPDDRSVAVLSQRSSTDASFFATRHGYGRLMVWRDGRIVGPLASLGHSLGYYGHHDWPVRWQ